MARLASSTVSLRIFGEDLDPDALSDLLDCDPCKAWRKGDVKVWATGQLVRKTGGWLLSATDTAPADFDAQIAEIFADLPTDLALWKDLGSRFQMDLFCGWFMEEGGEGFSISPETTRAIGERGLGLEVCLYGPSGRDARDPPDGFAFVPLESAQTALEGCLTGASILPDEIFERARAAGIEVEFHAVEQWEAQERDGFAYAKHELFDRMFEGRPAATSECFLVLDAVLPERALRFYGGDLRAAIGNVRAFDFDSDAIFVWPAERRISVFHHAGGFFHVMVPPT